MSYQVIARKWRPQSFHELVGQDHVAQTLVNALKSSRLPHALLFTGPRGTGKTSSARILAKILRCPNVKDMVPCHECSDCADISSGRSLDVLEIDGASNNGVDAIRELRDTVGYMPSSGRFKIYIIDEVHMLSTSAFNALLKTLEEPPAHVIFVLATTEVHKIPNTILSRCQRFDFRTISTGLIAERLQHICKEEKIPAEKEALWMVARQSGGSMRDSQSLLDQVITYCNGRVETQKVIEVLGLTDRGLLVESVRALADRDTGGVIALLDQLFQSGFDPKLYVQDLLEEFRHLLFIKIQETSSHQLVDLPDSEIEQLREIGERLSYEDVHLLFDMCLKGAQDLQRAPETRIVLEMLLMRMAAAPRITPLSGLTLARAGTAQASSKEKKTPQPAVSKTTPTVKPQPQPSSSAPAPASQPAPAAMSAPPPPAAPKAGGLPNAALGIRRGTYEQKKAERLAQAQAQGLTEVVIHKDPAVPSRAVAVGAKSPAPTASPNSAPAEPLSKDPWFNFVQQVKKSNGLLGALLENTFIVNQTQKELEIGIPAKMMFLADQLQDPENVQRVEKFIAAFWKQSLKVSIKLNAAAADAPTPKAALEKKRQTRQQKEQEQIESHPLIQSAKKNFKSDIIAIKENS